MAQRIILLLVGLLCAFPFYMLAWIGVDSYKPMHFVNGDEIKLAKIITDVKGYNRKMAKLYRCLALGFLLAGILSTILPGAGIVLLILTGTAGIYRVYRQHRKLIEQYSK